ncbi:hypothetical protein B0T16DRAFT_415580 [Cercophora newfieldiana]|uniref:Secreted protein n=1 Tax=Cercophora newfieldiana TaxID=92897 RepID=A0AA40CMW8_9PEZI|nr:hypothetical protein B0T16DRAFT_415580 [Cercophora newfieldiana]
MWWRSPLLFRIDNSVFVFFFIWHMARFACSCGREDVLDPTGPATGKTFRSLVCLKAGKPTHRMLRLVITRLKVQL